MLILTFVNYLISLYNYIQGDNMNVNLKNKVVDYVTPVEACKIIGISEKSTPQITRWINEGKIKGVYPFGKSRAIPINWVKSECNVRGINWEGVELQEGQIGVSLRDYTPLNEIEKKYNTNNLAVKIIRGQIDNNYVIQFGRSWGIEREFIKIMFK